MIKFKIDKKFLLFPLEDSSSETLFKVKLDDNIITSFNVRLASKNIEYWAPLEVASYQGKTLTLYFEDTNNIFCLGISHIKQSDDFIFEYNEKYRPKYHFSSFYGWINDPNGLVYWKGYYHLFFQHNPFGSCWGNMTWGHAISTDLIKWKQLPNAILPDESGTIFSGSAIIDENNTANFGNDAMIAAYTSDGIRQMQNLAYSHDEGLTFAKFKNNPILDDPKIKDFRDPNIFWYEPAKYWVMALSAGNSIYFYSSEDLIKWTKLSEFDKIDNTQGVWECPDLFSLTFHGKKKWILIVSMNPGAPNGGSGTQYFIGNFDGNKFIPDELPYPLWLDWGTDNYAGVTWKINKKVILISWMNNWDYANNLPTLNFRGAMTLPRELKLFNNGKHLALLNYPVKQMLKLRNEKISLEKNIKIKNLYKISNFISTKQESFEIKFTIKLKKFKKFSFTLFNSIQEEISFTFDVKKQKILIDRSKSGNTQFSDKFHKNIFAKINSQKKYDIDLWVDKSSIELFIDDGKLSITQLVFPTKTYDNLMFNTFFKEEVILTDLKIYEIL